MDRTIRPGEATPEADWLHWPAVREAPALTAEALLPAGGRAIVVAPHPDDEVLAVGGLMCQLARLRRPPCVVAVTDGEASHPASPCWPTPRLAAERAREQARALQHLGMAVPMLHRLRFPDGGLKACVAELADALLPLLNAQDVVLTTWRLDGHPDHEAVAEACARAVARCGARLIEVPVWGWHWSHPATTPMPWQRARRLPLAPCDVRAKLRALSCFQTQLQPDVTTGAPPILGRGARARAARPFELLFV